MDSDFSRVLSQVLASRGKAEQPNIADRATVTVAELGFPDGANLFDVHMRAVERGFDGFSAERLEHEARRYGSQHMWFPYMKFNFGRIK